MDTTILETAMQTAIGQGGAYLLQWATTITLGSAMLLSLAWMMAGVLKQPREL
ncbi:MAG: hypothetical protein H7Z41_12690 [Cytophagales bacterium]|nr:hypothetical protein [Armatimonadota bacterium]